MNTPHSLISLKNVYAGYTPGKMVLKDVSMDIFPNDFIGIIGPNGGGKSTLLKAILGLLSPQKGTISYNFPNNNQNNIGYLPQINSFDKDFPIKIIDVVLSGMMNASVTKRFSKDDKEKAIYLLEKMGLKKLYNSSISNLSGGQMQRVFLCRAIINNPKVLILDEPNTFVDKNFENELYNHLLEFNTHMAILLVSHDIGTISSLVKTIACVNEQLHYHNSNKISEEILKTYNCPIELITHGKIPHRVLKNH
ncbi:ATP-binding cassette domain-containing protein [Marinilabiliaceae bacterium D04]|uniref:ATP-binding cassette domain-containing protein n=2 Tax=Plebeiibacterium marinum TaxID=2992111 RepID=A0AAE3MAV7_9BACT|nr:ATP-binding cassette domain-containing protein [Plebeiobacterium marinum]MCW3804446.1 ATP-binding cassette domain-containing protein [Plebeiobacterium marinum]